MHQPDSPRTPARHPALAQARGRIVRALLLLTVAVVAWVGWMLWRGEPKDAGEPTDARQQEPADR